YAATYYYAVLSYNNDGTVSISSATTSNMTLPLPSTYTVVFATAAATATAPLPAPSVALITVDIPIGTPDGYFGISTNAATSPADIPKTSLDAATHKLRNAALVSGSIVELHLYDVYGDQSDITAPARITITYTDANSDDIVDGAVPQAQADTLNLFNLDTSALVWNRQTSVVNKSVKNVYSDVDHFSFYALGSAVSAGGAFSATTLSTASIQWSWSTGSGVDGYHLYSSSASGYIVLPSTTGSYIDTGLRVNKAYTRWLKVSSGTAEINESAHVQKYTYALPPDAIPVVDTITASSGYMEWHFSAATAYEIECSTNDGVDYVHNRASFVPWQTIPLLSNKRYLVRLGAINGDNEVTPGIYSATRTFITPPLTVSSFTAVALSSYTIKWQWETEMFAGTDISGYRIYQSTTTPDAGLPTDSAEGISVKELNANTSFWIETFTDGAVPASNSRHTRSLKAVGNIVDNGNFLVSQKMPYFQKYTYAIAPATTTVVYLDPAPYLVAHVGENSLTLTWDVSEGAPRPGDGIASKYVIDHSTVPGFTIAVTSSIVGQPPQSAAGLTDNTKYDLRIGAINGDNEQTPTDALNPSAYSAGYKVMTTPKPPSAFLCAPHTDTAMRCTWSTSTYVNPDYIYGYEIGELHHRTVDGKDEIYWDPFNFLAGIDSHEYSLDYLMTNSTHTVSIWALQTDPDWVTGNIHYDTHTYDGGDWDCSFHYCHWGSNRLDYAGYTFATPPNDVSFDTIAARSIGTWWKEPIIPATKYRVERSTNIGENGPWVFVSSVTGNHYNDTGLTPSTTYSYRVGAINLLGIQTLGLADATTGYRRDYSFVQSTMTVQRSPTLYAIATSTASIGWWWTNDVPDVLFYNMYTSTNGILASHLTNTTNYWLEVNLSSANTRYTRRIRSVTQMGESDFSEASGVTFAADPTALAVTGAGLHSLSIEWSGNGGTSYRIDRSTDMNSWSPLKTWTDVYISTAFTDTHLRLATTYYYAASAYNQDAILSLGSATYSGGPSRTLDLPAGLFPVFSTETVTQSTTVALPGFGWITVQLPAGAAPFDGYIMISTAAETNPLETSAANINTATSKLLPSKLVPGSIAELYFYDLYGSTYTGNFVVPAVIQYTYMDADSDDILDGTSPQIRADTLKLLNLDTANLVWNPQSASRLDKAAKMVYSDINHFSFYALGSIITVTSSLADMRAYPNPYKPGSGGDFDQSVFGEGIVFEGLTARAKIRIYNIAGLLVAELNDDDGDGRCLWNARNGGGARVASGIYIYSVTNPGGSGGKKSGKITIIK
ncbi:MAG TPA: hypothetical protein DCL44_12150, partial [Elusimicrobia bacterium]|nr:hypothetical protein [Elusimicrobiota bacterium]